MLFFRQLRNTPDQSLCVLVGRTVEDIICRAVFYNLACIHNGDSVTHVGNNAQVMGDHDNRHAQFFL